MKTARYLLLAFAAAFVAASVIHEDHYDKLGTYSFISFEQGDSYEDLWKEVDSLEKRYLPRSAKEVVEKIYDKATTDKNPLQKTKTIKYLVKYNKSTVEESDSVNIAFLGQEIAQAEVPFKQILQSLTAQTYYDYYQANRWSILNRTHVTEKPKDFRTWDAHYFLQTISHYYSQATQPFDELIHYSSTDFSPLFENQKAETIFTPTLFDILADQALSFFMSTESSLTQASDAFQMEAKKVLTDAKQFEKLRFSTTDSSANHLNALRILQDLIHLHYYKEDPTSFIDRELERIAFLYEYSTGIGKDSIRMNLYRDLAGRYKKHRASSDVYYSMAKVLQEAGNSYNYLSRMGDPNAVAKAYRMCSYITETFKQDSTYRGVHNCRSIQEECLLPHFQMRLENVYPTDQTFRFFFTYKNQDTVHFRIIRNTDAVQKAARNAYGKDKLKLYLAQPNVRSWKQGLPNPKQFRTHSVELKAEGLPSGKYIILACSNESFDLEKEGHVYGELVCSNLAAFAQKDKDYDHHMYVTDRNTGEPLPNVKLIRWSGYEYEKRLLSTHQTDETGKVIVPYDSKYYSYSFSFIKGNDTLDQTLYVSTPYTYEPSKRPKVYFFTDRNIYRPGQKVHFKGIVLQKESKKKTNIKANHAVKVSFLDANYQKVKTLNLTSNEYGTISGTFTAPDQGLNGRMQIQADIGGGKSFRVEEYKRPKFELAFDSIKGSYRLNQRIRVTGEATTYSGAKVDGAKVQYNVKRTARFPYWGCYFWWAPSPSSPAQQIVSGTAQTDSEGKFSIDFQAIPDNSLPEGSRPVFSYEVSVDVIDITGETQSKSTYVSVGELALDLSASIPEEIRTNSLPPLHIQSRNLNGSFEPAKGNIKIYPLTPPQQSLRSRRWVRPEFHTLPFKEYKKDFLHDVYGDEDDYRSWKKGEAVINTYFNTKDTAQFDLSALGKASQGRYLIELTSQDKYGSEVKAIVYTTLINPQSTESPYPTSLHYSLNKDTAEPGETVTLSLSTSEPNLWVLYEIEQDAKVLHRELLKLSKGKKDIPIKIEESHRGNINLSLSYICHNEFIDYKEQIRVPWTNKELKLEWMSFRSKLQPNQEEQWKVKITGSKSEKVAAELVATLYDASLETFTGTNHFDLDVMPSFSSLLSWSSTGFSTTQAYLQSSPWRTYHYVKHTTYPKLFDGAYLYRARNKGNHISPTTIATGQTILMDETEAYFAPEEEFEEVFEKNGSDVDYTTTLNGGGGGGYDLPEDRYIAEDKPRKPKAPAPPPRVSQETQTDGKDAGVKIRTNLNESAFFFPELTTNEAGEIILSFTMPEALTRWKFAALAHTKELQIGTLIDEVVTQKELMVMPNPPRFFRENDKQWFSAKIANLSDKPLEGNVELRLLDARTMKSIGASFKLNQTKQAFSVPAKQSTVAKWLISIPAATSAVVTQVIAKAGKYGDGEENPIPILSNRMLVTESLPLPIRGEETRSYTFDKLINASNSSTLKHQRLSLEFTSNPAWYAVQSLPYLMEYPHECTEQIFSRMYANTLATHIANSTPKIQQVFEKWREKAKSSSDKGRNALLSNLEHNQELKAVLLEETPWVLDAQDEGERKRRVGLLFDLSRMSNEQSKAIKQLEKRRHNSGAYAWFPGMPESRYITQLIATGIGHLKKLGVKIPYDATLLGDQALDYLGNELRKDYIELKKDSIAFARNSISYMQIQYLYMRSFYKSLPIRQSYQEANNYYYNAAKEKWGQQSIYMQAMIALTLHRNGDTQIAKDILKSLKERSLNDEELGRYWKLTSGYYWYQASTETQALLIEAFDEITQDRLTVEEMKLWLLKQKQTQDWRSTRATVEACNALLLTGSNLLASDKLVSVSLGGQTIDPTTREDTEVEAGTGYFKTTWKAHEIKSDMGKVKVTKSDPGAAWGALYWQYFEQLDKITFASTPISIQKDLFIETPSSTGPVLSPIKNQGRIRQGDKVVVRVEIRVDRDMEYVHMKDMRASGLEPIHVLSQYRYQDGLGYYETTRDAATHFFIEYLPKGTYVFEYPLRATHKGDFSNGITTIQCMYAPEFTSHSDGIRIQID